jgi:hypothetical protein
MFDMMRASAYVRNILRLQQNVICFMHVSPVGHAACVLKMHSREKRAIGCTHESPWSLLLRSGEDCTKQKAVREKKILDLRLVHRGAAISLPVWDA